MILKLTTLLSIVTFCACKHVSNVSSEKGVASGSSDSDKSKINLPKPDLVVKGKFKSVKSAEGTPKMSFETSKFSRQLIAVKGLIAKDSLRFVDPNSNPIGPILENITSPDYSPFSLGYMSWGDAKKRDTWNCNDAAMYFGDSYHFGGADSCTVSFNISTNPRDNGDASVELFVLGATANTESITSNSIIPKPDLVIEGVYSSQSNEGGPYQKFFSTGSYKRQLVSVKGQISPDSLQFVSGQSDKIGPVLENVTMTDYSPHSQGYMSWGDAKTRNVWNCAGAALYFGAQKSFRAEDNCSVSLTISTIEKDKGKSSVELYIVKP